MSIATHLTRPSLSIVFSFIVTGCGIGLQTNGPLEDSAVDVEPASEPDSSSTDTNTTDTNTTDTSDTNDTNDTDTDTGTLIPSLVTSMSPLYGSTAGGESITIMGGPFTSDASVLFGGNPGIVTSNNGSMIRVNTPAAVVEGPVEVRVDMDDGYGLPSDPYLYFQDGLGKTSTIGVISRVEYIGQYWNGGVLPDQTASMWTAFTTPLDVHFWQLSTPALDTCARNGVDSDGNGINDDVNGDGVVNSSDYYEFSGNLTVIDVGADSVTMNGTSSITLPRGSTDQSSISYYLYESPGILDPSSVPENAFYDLNVTTGPLNGMTVAQYARASRRIAPLSPSLNTSTLQAVSSTQTFSWSQSQADWIEIRMFQVNTSNFIVSDVICNVEDDGNFAFQNIHQTWTPGEAIYVQFTRVYESNITMPHNDGVSRVIGSYTIFGAGYMN